MLRACVWLLLAGTAPAQAEEGPAWTTLTPAQQQALAPLEPNWPTMNAGRKQKWLDVAARFPRLPAAEQSRVQARMSAWGAMTPKERARARLQYEESRRLSPEEREARWQAYRSLPDDERRALAAKAHKAPRAGAHASDGRAGRTNGVTAKNNVVATPLPAPRPRPVAPALVQVAPGVSTTTMTRRSAPPRHQQSGLPKIVATPGFVDPDTLLPRRGPQGAAASALAASVPVRQP